MLAKFVGTMTSKPFLYILPFLVASPRVVISQRIVVPEKVITSTVIQYMLLVQDCLNKSMEDRGSRAEFTAVDACLLRQPSIVSSTFDGWCKQNCAAL
jgi:hypothetical protein